MISPKELKEFKLLARKSGIDLSIIYGSAVTGKPGPEPDIDIAVRLKKYNNRRAYKLFSDIHRIIKSGEVDLVFINRIDPLLQMEIARKGVPIYEASFNLFRLYQVYATKMYNDAQRFFQADKAVIKAFLKH